MLKRNSMKISLYKLSFLIFFILTSCASNENDEIQILSKRYDDKIASTFGVEFKENLFTSANDTLLSWKNNKLLVDSVTSNAGKLLIWQYNLDSTICVNSLGNKFIGTIHQFGVSDGIIAADDIIEFFGAKIKEKWYFWTGGAMPVLRNAYENHPPTKPLSYAQLHEQAMNNFLGGYLTKDGEINDKWFEGKFKSGRFTFEQRYKYEWILDGKKIDNEQDYWNYSYRKSSMKLWDNKWYRDSVDQIKQINYLP